MKLSEYDGSKLRLVLIGMITDTKVCSRIASIMDKPKGQRFNQPWADTIAKWCLDHLRKYNSAPNDLIGIIFRRWAETSHADKDTINQIEALLEYLSEEYSGSVRGNSDFVLDLAQDYFNKNRLKEVVEDVEGHLDVGQVDKAYSQLNSTSKIELGYSTVINPLKDVDVWIDTFNDERERPLFEYPGELGRMVGPSFTKGTLFGFMGIDKGGKSFYLMDAAFRALKSRHRVAYFEVGDLGRDETIRRLGQRICRQPVYEEIIKWPTGWKPESDEPTTRERKRAGVSISHSLARIRRFTRNRDLMRLSCHPNSSITVSGIESYLQDWARESCWIPDVIIIDYADILAPPQGFIDPKDQIDEVWKQLRRISQTYNALVLTATQTGAQAYRKKGSALSKTDFGGRKTKFAHVNGMLGLNSKPEDMRNGVTRVNWVVRRKGAYSENSQVVVAGNFAAGTPIILSKKAEWKRTTNAKAGTDHKE